MPKHRALLSCHCSDVIPSPEGDKPGDVVYIKLFIMRTDDKPTAIKYGKGLSHRDELARKFS